MWTYVKQHIWGLLLGLNYILVIVFSILILLKNRNPIKTLSYIFTLAVFPFLGLLVYYLFGQDYRKSKIFEKKYILDNEKIIEWREKFSLDHGERKDFKDEYGEEAYKIYKLLTNNSKAVLTFDNAIEILLNGEVKFKKLLEDLSKAKTHIHLEYFVFFDDELGKKIIAVLCEKAKEGVKVRVIYDDVGSNIAAASKKKLSNAGVAHYPFMPVIFSNSTSKLNYRNHRKIVVIDGTLGYLGGINIDKKYDNSFSNERYWRDTHLRLKGGAVGSLQSSFLLSWSFVSNEEVAIESGLFPKSKVQDQQPAAVQVVASGPDSDWANIMEVFFCAVNMAKERVYITTPYFVPNDSILTALSTAARSGVDVRIIIPYDSDSWAAQYATDSYITQCLESGIRVYRYKKGFIHAKTMLTDTTFSSVGTANMDYRSFALNFEINALIYNEAINEQLYGIFKADLKESEEVRLERWEERGLLRRLKESFSRLWAPLL